MVRQSFQMNQPMIYAQTARFDGSARALTEGELYRLAPSVFAVDKHDSRTERFQPIPTFEVVKALAKEGFAVVGARQSTTRDVSKRAFTKHMLRLRKLGDQSLVYDGNYFEMYLRNANDGTSSYELLAGIFRKLCDNSLTSMTSELEHVRVRHSGDVAAKVVTATYEVLGVAEQVLAAPQDWSQIKIDREEAKVMARAAHTIRFGANDDGSVRENGIQPTQLLEARRVEDTNPNVWTVMNVLQENVIKGGQSGFRYDANHRLRRNTTRAVRGIDQDTSINRALWRMAAEFADLKKAA